MASESEASCEEDPNFAVICAFLEKFGETVGITNNDFMELQSMLENTHEVPKYLVELHVKLLRKIRKPVSVEKWEKSLIRCCHTFSSQDAWELERFGYKNAKLSSKIRILKELLELQFDFNTKFKAEVNKLASNELRSKPIGRDKFGHAYWFQSDDNYQIRVYKEDLDDEQWTLVAKDRDGLIALINTLSDGDIKISSDSAGNEDSNSLLEKPVIDTGQQDDSKETSDNANNEEGESLKRPRDETEEEKMMFQKYKIKNLEIVVSDVTKDPILCEGMEKKSKTEQISVKDESCNGLQPIVKEKSPIIGEEIEEAEMKVQGEGSGVDNQSPIVGEVIEEQVMYFFGNGSGNNCETGNEPEQDEHESASTAEEKANSEEKTNSEDKIGIENKTKIEDLSSNNATREDCNEKDLKGPSIVLKEKGVEDTSNTPLEEGEVKETTVNSIENEKDIVDNLIEKANDELKDTIDNKVVNNKEEKASDAEGDKKYTLKENVTIEVENFSEKIEKDIKETDVNTKQSENDFKPKELIKSTIEKESIIEPICVKKVAYLCGEKESNEKLENSVELQSNGKESDKSEEYIEETKISEKTEQKANACAESNGKGDVESPESVEDDVKSEEEQPTRTTRSKVKNASIQPEAVFVPETKEKTEKLANHDKKKSRPVRRAVKRKAVEKTHQNDKQDPIEKLKGQSADSSMTNSPAQSVGDSSVTADFTAGDSRDAEAAPELDPLAVSGSEAQEPKETVSLPSRTTRSSTLRTFSLDYNDSDSQKPAPVTTSAMRAIRKRGRENSTQKSQEADNGPEKRMKLKGRRQVDTALRKSVEQRIEQLHDSSSESKDSDEDKPAPKTSRHKKKQAKDITPKKPINRHPEKKNSRILAGLDILEDSSNDRPGPRQSRRIAQMKIKEQMDPKPTSKTTQNDDALVGSSVSKKKKGKNEKPEKRKRNKYKEEVTSEPEVVVEKKKKKKKEKPLSRLFNEKRPWQSSTDDSDDAVEEEEEEDVIEEEDDPPLGDLKSDHEFSPESDLEGENEGQPMKRARTAVKDSDQIEVDDFPCQKCGKLDHPEWILLCDKCDNGWHCSCLRPPLLVIPEGDWFCPPCQHVILLEQLQVKLVEYDKKLSKKEIEDRRKERLAYVGISLNNVLPTKESIDHRKTKRRHFKAQSSSEEEEEESEYSESDSESDSDEPIYQLRQRRQAKSYKFNEYDEMMKTAIGEELDKPEDTAGNLGRGKDIQTIVKGLEPEPKAPENDARSHISSLKKMLRKKHRKLNSLESDSEEEDISDEDFKGSSSESEEDEDEESAVSEDSDDYVGRKRRKKLPIRRSTRARTKRYDSDFINDDSDEAPKRKKKKSIWDESETEESDVSGWGKGRKGKKKKRSKKGTDLGERKRNKARIKYGGLTSSDEDLGRGRRTRGKTATYVDTLGSDSEEERIIKKNPRRIVSDDEEFVANEEEDDEKGSEDNVEEEDEPGQEDVEEEPDSEEERREKRSLLVPKIYIKKPLGMKKSEVKAIPTTAPNSILEAAKPVTTEQQKLEDNNIVKTEIKMSGSTSDPKLNQMVTNSVENQDVNTAVKTETEVVIKSEKKTDDDVMYISDVKSEKSSNPVILGKRGHEVHEPLEKPEPIVSNVSALIKNLDGNDDLSEPPGIALPLFEELATGSGQAKQVSSQEPPRRRRSKIVPMRKKTLEETLACIGKKIPVSESPAIEIAAPPQPFSQAQPTPSIITRMLQTTPGQTTIYPVGTIRPKQFATMRDDDSSDDSPKGSRESSPARPPTAHVPYTMPGGIRGSINLPYRQQPPHHISLNHYPRAPSVRGPPTTHVPPAARGSSLATHGPQSSSRGSLPGSHGPLTSSHGPSTSHGPPPSARSSPLATHGPPPSHGLPTSSHGQPPPSHAPLPSRAPPSTTHGSPSSHGPPLSLHGPPTPSHGPPTPSHGPPTPSHGPPISSHGPPTSLGPSIPSHGSSISSHGPPMSSHVPPSSHGPPSSRGPPSSHGIPSSHGPSTSSHGSPIASHGPPTSSHGPITSSHGPITSHGPPTSSHGPPTSSHGPPVSSHGPPISSHGPPISSHGPPTPSHGPPTPSHGPPTPSHGPPTPSHGPPTSSHGLPQPHRPPPHSHCPSPSPHPYQHHSSHRSLDPSPSGGGPINLADPAPVQPTSSPTVRYPPVNQPPPIIRGPPRSQPHLSHQQSYQPPPPTSTEEPQPPSDGYYGNYPPPPPNEDAMPPTSYQGSEGDPPYSEQYVGTEQAQENRSSDNSNSKAYEDESGGEFAGLASYFSSQREDDLES